MDYPNPQNLSFYYVYVLFSVRDKKLYIGFTRNVFKRLAQHNEGKTKSTACRRPLQLIYYEAHLLKKDALRRESYFKTTSGKRSLRIMLNSVLSELGYYPNNTTK